MTNITLRLLGGVGNQMFQIATAYAIARQYNWDLHMDLSRFFGHSFGSNKDLDLVKNINLTYTQTTPKWQKYKNSTGITRPFLRLYASYLKRCEVLFCDGQDIHLYHHRIQTIKPNTILRGYFQSYKYFDHVKNPLKIAFDLPISPAAQPILSHIQNLPCPVAIHYRDYRDPNQGSTEIARTFGMLDMSYYQRAMAYVKNRHPNATFYLFSNRPAVAKTIFSDCHIVDYAPENSWDDMMIMTHCHHIIMGNSSYSWWAGYLNRHPNPIVITHKDWGNLLKNKNTEDIFLADWIKM